MTLAVEATSRLVRASSTDFPATKGASHYFAARETESAPLRVGRQQEKFLFYRGFGDFQAPLRARLRGRRRRDRASAPGNSVREPRREGRISTGERDSRRSAGADRRCRRRPRGARRNAHRGGTVSEGGARHGRDVARFLVRRGNASAVPRAARYRRRAAAAHDNARPARDSPASSSAAVELLSPAMRETIGRAIAARDTPPSSATAGF